MKAQKFYLQHVTTYQPRYRLCEYNKNIAVWLTSYLCEATTHPSVISPYLACINETTVAALCAPWNLYFLISFCVIAALAAPWLGDIIIVITTSSSSCRQIILPGSFFSSPLLQLHRGGEITFFTKPFCCLYCDSDHTPSHSPSLSYEYPTIGVMVKKEKKEKKNQSRGNSLFTAQSHTTFSLWIEE